MVVDPHVSCYINNARGKGATIFYFVVSILMAPAAKECLNAYSS